MTTPAPTTRERARHVLRDTYGYADFRGPQADIIETVADGGDALVLMPTGGGKSLCYQIPALLRPGVAVVVSPLIALMKDQVDALRQLGVEAAFLNSSLSYAEQEAIERSVRAGTIDLLYVAPERLMTPRFLQLLDALELALFAIDEAHCVSQWGHDFRPEYIQLGELARRFPDVPRIALTATADARTRAEMAEKLELERARRFVSSFDRPNIRYTVVDKRNARHQLLRFIERTHPGEAGIVYCLSRKSVDSTAAWLLKRGVNAIPYHAGLDAETRQAHQERFLREDGLVVVATIAFGMGIDKPDVRFVAHLDVPKSLEAYYQETGRAGRDGLPSDAFMTYGLQDVVMVRRMVDDGTGSDAHKRDERQKLDALLGYCETARCRRQVLLEYFGESHSGDCGNCDVCLDGVETWDGTVAAQKLLSTVARTGNRFGAGHLVDVLRGADTKRIRELGHDTVSTYGIGDELDAAGWRSVARQLVAAGYLRATDYGGLQMAPPAAKVLKGDARVELRKDSSPRSGASGRAARARTTHDDLPDDVRARFDALRGLRTELAKEQGVPPYVVFHDATLRQMAEEIPTTRAGLRGVSGVGETKLARYGDAFLEVLRGFGAAAEAGAAGEPRVEQPELLAAAGGATAAADAPPAASTADAGRPDALDDDGLDTVETTRELILEGYGTEAVASMRGLKLRTVEGHVADLVARGDLTVEEATGLGREDVDRIEAALDTLPADERRRLKPLYERLGGAYSYLQIKCVRAGLGI